MNRFKLEDSDINAFNVCYILERDVDINVADVISLIDFEEYILPYG